MRKKSNSQSLFSEEEMNNIQQTLFSAEELNQLDESQEAMHKDGPVTVLGMTFPNDEARRQYFRDELRKKLPELRHIEGFPIGEDEDIINLSDPPYYTACPNPWLNDFVAEWEAEKVQLETEGKRNVEFEVKEPYAADVNGIKNDSVYRAHMYHTKVPHALIMRYLLHYTQPGDIVFDGFAGTGMTGVAAQACGDDNCQHWEAIEIEWIELFNSKPNKGQRHAICGDLSPFASTISYNYNTPASSIEVEKEINRIYKEIEEECGWMYTTLHEGKAVGKINCVVWSDIIVCNNCGEEFVYWDAAVDKNNKKLLDDFYCPKCHALHNKRNAVHAQMTIYDRILDKNIQEIKSVPVIIVYTVKNKRFEKRIDNYDLDIINKIKSSNLSYSVPSYNLPEGGETQRNVKIGVTSVHQFYTQRSLITLSIFYDKIKKSSLPLKLKFIFTGMINRSTKMNKVHFTKYLNGKSDWDAGYLKGTLYIPPFSVETSVLSQIINKSDRFIKAIPMLPKNYDNALYIGSAHQIGLENNSIDYIFTDPPFGANIAYSELNFLPEAWLKVMTNNNGEAIVNPNQDKNFQFYLDMMTKCYKEYFRILKPGKWMTVEFSNTNAAVWNSIQQSITRSGFVIANISTLNKGQGGMRAVTTTTAVKQDLAISCYKPSERILSIDYSDIINNVWVFIEEHLEHLPSFVVEGNQLIAVPERDPRILYDRMISYFVQHGLPVPLDAQEFQQGLRERFVERDGMFFTATQAAEYDEKKKTATDFVPMGIIVSSEAEGIAWLKNQLRDKAQTYQDLQPEWMQAINGVRKGDILPELRELLEENFIEESDGKWRLPNMQDDVDKAALRAKALLREFKIYVETAHKPKGKIKEARVEALRAGFKQCYIDKDFQTIVTVGDRIPQNLRDEDEVLLQFYDIALNKI